MEDARVIARVVVQLFDAVLVTQQVFRLFRAFRATQFCFKRVSARRSCRHHVALSEQRVVHRRAHGSSL